MQLENYAAGQWIVGSGKQSDLIDAITGEIVATTSSGPSSSERMDHRFRRSTDL